MNSAASNGGLQNIISDLRRKIEQLDALSETAVVNLSARMMESVEEVHPGRTRWSTGLLASILKTKFGPVKEGTTWWVGFGPYQSLGSQNEPAPRGTIAAFLKYLRGTWYPQRAKMREAAKLEARLVSLDRKIERANRRLAEVMQKGKKAMARLNKLSLQESEEYDKMVLYEQRASKPRPGVKTRLQRATERRDRLVKAQERIGEIIRKYEQMVREIRAQIAQYQAQKEKVARQLERKGR